MHIGYGLGGVGIAAGLFVYGTKLHIIGEKLVKSHHRGVAIELSSRLLLQAVDSKLYQQHIVR